MTTVMATMALTLVLLEMGLRRLDAHRLRFDVAIANADGYRALQGQVRELRQRCEGLEVRLREQELRP